MPKIISLTYQVDSNTQKTLNFSRIDSHQGLTTTIITGENGTGKSSILKRIVDYYFRRDKKRILQKSDIRVSDDSYFEVISSRPSSRVLAISGTSSDRFPIHVGIFQENYDDDRYVYLGQKVNSNLLSKKRSLETIVTYLLDQVDRVRLDSPILSELYSKVGIQPELEIKLRAEVKLDSSKSRIRYLDDIWSKLGEIQDAKLKNNDSRSAKELQRNLHISSNTASHILNSVDRADFLTFESFIKANHGRREVKLNIIVTENTFSKELSPGAVRLGILLGVFKVDDVLVRSKSFNQQLSIFDLSSGEFHFFTSILGVHICAEPDSIILIDEPENSLHPKWQMDFMSLLYQACKFVSDGHLIISTHSPLVVSSATAETVLINMSDEDVYEPNDEIPAQLSNIVYGASLESILMDQFGLVSSRNLHFIDLLQRVIDLFSNGDIENPEFKDGLNHLNEIKNKLKSDDPLVELINVLSGE